MTGNKGENEPLPQEWSKIERSHKNLKFVLGFESKVCAIYYSLVNCLEEQGNIECASELLNDNCKSNGKLEFFFKHTETGERYLLNLKDVCSKRTITGKLSCSGGSEQEMVQGIHWEQITVI